MDEPQERFNQDLWWIMQEIKYEGSITVNDEPVDFVLRVDDKAPRPEAQRKLLYRLQEMGLLTVDPIETGLPDAPNQKYTSHTPESATLFELTIIPWEFDKVYSKLSYRFANMPKTSSSKSTAKIHARLEKDGSFLYLVGADNKVQIKKFNPDSQAERLVSYLLHNQGKTVTLNELHEFGRGFDSLQDIGDKLRAAGFTPSLKRQFVPGVGKDKARLVDEAEMTQAEFDSLIMEATARNRNKSNE